MKNIIILVIVAVLIGLAAWYIYKAKKNGRKCIGCPEANNCCSKDASGCCCCGNTYENKQ